MAKLINPGINQILDSPALLLLASIEQAAIS
jgi:hypothetical protein